MSGRAELAIMITGQNAFAPAANAVTASLNGIAKAALSPISAVGGLAKGLGTIGLAGLGIQTVASAAKGLTDALGVGLVGELEQTRARFMAMTKDAGLTEKILADIRQEANSTPFAFREMSSAAASLMPAAKMSGIALMDLIKQAEILAASNPAEGLEGAAFAIKEALSGDFVSIVERFNLPRQRLNELKAQGVPAMKAIQTAMKEMGLDADLVAAQAQTMAGRWSTFMDTIDTVKMQVAEPIFDVLKEALMGLQGVFDENSEAIGQFAQGVANNLRSAIEIGKALFTAFTVDAGAMGIVLDRVRDIFGDTVADGIQPFVHAFMEAIPRIKQFASDLVSFIGNAVDVVQRVLGGDFRAVIAEVAQTVAASAPHILAAVRGWAQAFLSWVGPMIPPLLGQLGGLVVELNAWILGTAAPTVARAVLELHRAFIEWVGPMIPPLLAELGTMLGQMADWVGGTAIPTAVGFLAEMAGHFVGWVAKDVIPNLPGALNAIIETIKGWVASAGPTVAAEAVPVGTSLITGLVSGLQSAAGQLFAAASSLAQQALQRFRAAFDSHSPSREMMVIGQDVAEGLALGIIQKIPKVKQAVKTVGDSILDEMHDLTRSMDDLLASSMSTFIQIGEKAGRAINAAIIDASKALDDAFRSAQRSIGDAIENLGLSRALRGRRGEFSDRQDAQALERSRAREDAEERRKLAKELEKAKTDDERKAILERFAEMQDDLKHRRRNEDEDRAYRKRQEQDRQEFEDHLENEALQRQVQRITQERDERVSAINQALADKRRAIEEDAQEERERLLEALVQKVADLKANFVEKLPPLIGESETIVTTFLDRLSGLAEGLIDDFRRAMAAANDIPREITTIHRVVTVYEDQGGGSADNEGGEDAGSSVGNAVGGAAESDSGNGGGSVVLQVDGHALGSLSQQYASSRVSLQAI